MKYFKDVEDGYLYMTGKYAAYLKRNMQRIGRDYVNLCLENDFFHDLVFKDFNFQLHEDGVLPTGGKHVLTMKLSNSFYDDDKDSTEFLIQYDGVERVDFNFDSKYIETYVWGEIKRIKGFLYHEVKVDGGIIFIKAREISAKKIR